MTPKEQLDLWVEGVSVHNSSRDECCPDFSCCNPDLLASEKERIAFRDATESERMPMLGIFLARMLELHGAHVKSDDI